MGSEKVYVVRDASGEYVADPDRRTRTPASNEAYEFASRHKAEAACRRSTDQVLVRMIDPDEVQ